jgi:SAM-dependent methyltransferase
MTDSARPALFFENDLTNADLEEILRRIDENLELRPVLSQHQDGDAPLGGPPPLPDPADLPLRLQGLQRMRAPLFLIYGRSWRDRAKQALNLPIRLFGRKQIAFNRDLLETLQIVLACLQDVRRFAEHQLRQTGQHEVQIQDTARRVEELEQVRARLEQAIAQHKQQLEQVQQEAQRQNAWLDAVASDTRGQSAWLDALTKDVRGQAAWLDLVDRKYILLAREVREQLGGPQGGPQELPEPRIIDPERYAARLAAMGGQVRVNLASGEKPWPDYINVDFREAPDTDVVADVRNLPFEDGSLAEIASAHLVEHFREHQLRAVVLPYWRRLLRPGGALRVICPNWQAMLDRLRRGEMSLADFKLLTFGGQDYEGDDHFAMYTPDTLSALLRESGFERVEVVAAERMNGICPEMEVVAYL